jgi:type IV pilus assembly protein PilB
MASVFKKSLGELLMDKGIVDKRILDEAMAIQLKSGKKLGKILLEKGYLDENTLYSFLEDQLGVPFKISIDFDVKPEIFNLIPLRYCKNKAIAPVGITSKSIKVFISEPTNTAMINEISFMTGRVVEIDYATESAIIEYLNKFSPSSGKTYTQSAGAVDLEDEIKDKGEVSEDDSPVVRFVAETIRNGIERNVSDIHFEAYDKHSVLRYRIDGVLQKIDDIDKRMYPAIISRIKILAELDISEKRLPQDGRIMMKYEDRKIDIRVSIIPTAFGENAVLRILDKGKKVLTLSDLGLTEELVNTIEKESKKPYGMVLVTGPTGSGKTTTLYAVLQYVLSFGNNKILTIEDPIEYQIEGISQVQVHDDIGLTFAEGLRSFLRHDPDVIMVGEIRDRETAEIAVRSAMTGHLVLSTVHTNDSASSITRFIDMGIPAYFLTSTINAIIAQRLVRKICPKCKEEKALKKSDIESLGIDDYFKAGDKVYYGKGCKACGKTGYSGRTPIFELLRMTDTIKRAVIEGKTSFEIKEIAKRDGMLLLRDFGFYIVKKGITTLDEIEKVVALGDE